MSCLNQYYSYSDDIPNADARWIAQGRRFSNPSACQKWSVDEKKVGILKNFLAIFCSMLCALPLNYSVIWAI